MPFDGVMGGPGMDYIRDKESQLNQRGIPGPSALAGYDPATQQAIVAKMMEQRQAEESRMAMAAGAQMGGPPTGGPGRPAMRGGGGGGGGGGSGGAMVARGVFNPLDDLQRLTSKTGY